MDQSMTRHAEIAGAGLTGLALAAALGRLGWSVRVHEASDQLRATGGGLYMTQDGLGALDKIGALEQLSPYLIRPAGYETRVNGRFHSRDANDGAFATTLRQRLHEVLQSAARDAGVEVVANSRAVAADPNGQLTLEDGRQLDADLVIAADGVGSGIAASVGIAADRRRFDDSLVRVLLDRTSLTGREWEDAIDLWHYGDRPLRILFSPCSPTQCYLVMMAPVTDPEAASLPIDSAIWSRYFPELAPLFDQSFDKARIDRYGSIRLSSWIAGRVAIIGDAAHAMPSSLGKGANLGMGNAISLADALAAEPDIDRALSKWHARQRPVVKAAQDMAERVALARTLTADPDSASYEVPLVGTV